MGNWERKLGLIVPSWNTVMEYEVQRMAGGAMSVHAARIPHPRLQHEVPALPAR